MNVITIQEASSYFIKRKQSKYAGLRDAILNLGDGQALFISFGEFSEKAIQANVAFLRKAREGYKLSVRRHVDGSGVFVFYTAKG